MLDVGRAFHQLIHDLVPGVVMRPASEACEATRPVEFMVCDGVWLVHAWFMEILCSWILRIPKGQTR